MIKFLKKYVISIKNKTPMVVSKLKSHSKQYLLDCTDDVINFLNEKNIHKYFSSFSLLSHINTTKSFKNVQVDAEKICNFCMMQNLSIVSQDFQFLVQYIREDLSCKKTYKITKFKFK